MKLLYSIQEAAKILSIGRSKLYELIKAGAIATVKVGQRRLVPDESIKAYVASLMRMA